MRASSSKTGSRTTTPTAVPWALWIILALLPITLLGLFAFDTASQSVTESYRASSLAAAVVAADFVSDDFQRGLSLAGSLAELPGFVRAVTERDADDVRGYLRTAVSLYPALDRAFVHDVDGVMWSDYPPAPEALGRSFADHQWYAGVSEQWEPYISAAYVRHAAPQVLVVAIVVPVRDQAGKVIGILVTQYRLDSIREGLGRVRWGETGMVFLLDSNGHVAGHPDIELEQRIYDEYADLKPVQDALQGITYTGEFADPVTGELTVATFYPVATRSWAVVAQQSADEAYAPIRRIAWNIGGAGVILALAAASVVIGLWRASESNRRLNVVLQEQTKRQRHLTGELTSAEQRERKHLATLLHDDLQQLLVAARMRINKVRQEVPDERVKQVLGEIGDWIDQAITSARDLTYELRPPALYEAGLVEALHWLATRIWERHQLRVEIKSEGAFRPLRDEIKALLFDCVRELLFNVTKHAGVDRATVSVFEEGDSLYVIVEDAGRGFDVEAKTNEADGGGFGLFSIGERLLALDATMTTESRIGSGTRTKLIIPLAVALTEGPSQ